MTSPHIVVATAGWSIPATAAARMPGGGTHLERYARVLAGTEVNLTFHRSPRHATLRRWRESVGPAFRFAVKVPRAVTHGAGLDGARDLIVTFLDQVSALGSAFGPLLFQLPPGLACDAGRLAFFEALRHLHAGEVVCEPRHASWFTPEVDSTLADLRVARVAADPARVPAAGEPGGWPGFTYYRLHGSPRVYHSEYSAQRIEDLSGRVRASARHGRVWCVFDNTASGAALSNALDLLDRLEGTTAVAGADGS